MAINSRNMINIIIMDSILTDFDVEDQIDIAGTYNLNFISK